MEDDESDTGSITPTSLMPPPKPVDMKLLNPNINAFPMVNGPQRIGMARKKPLAPGHSPMDWAKLKASTDLRNGITALTRYTLEDLALHNKKDNLWMAYQGKVYNVTQYLPYHPVFMINEGGVGQLMRGAGKDATDMIKKIHPWVNIDVMLDKCFIGYLVRDF